MGFPYAPFLHRHSWWRPVIATALTLGAAQAKAGPTHLNIPVKRVVAPEHVFEGVRSVQVDDFDGMRGAVIAEEIRATLRDSNRHTANTAVLAQDVAEAGGAVASVVAEKTVGGGLQGRWVRGMTHHMSSGIQQGLDLAPIQLDDGLSVDVIQVRSEDADAQLTGTVSVRDETSQLTKKVVVKDARGNLVKDLQGRTQYTERLCTQRTVGLSVTWALHREERTLVGKTFARQDVDSHCEGEDKALKSTQELVDGLVPGLGRRIAVTFAPAWRIQRLSLSRDRALKFDNQNIRSEDYLSALCGLSWFVAAVPDHVGGHLNLGVISEALGYYGLATTEYAAAAVLREDRSTARAKQRMARRRDDVSTMTAAYGLTWTLPDTPDLSTCPANPEDRARTVKREGKLRSESKGGEVRTEVAKGTRVWLLESGRDVAHVRLEDGQTGWIDAHRLK
jgi:hypothetical protein